MRGLKSPDAVRWAAKLELTRAAQNADPPDLRNAACPPCTRCGHENPPDTADGSCEVCDAPWNRHGYDIRRDDRDRSAVRLSGTVLATRKVDR
jgi:hypothetical protein